jgi:hypothetical protein
VAVFYLVSPHNAFMTTDIYGKVLGGGLVNCSAVPIGETNQENNLEESGGIDCLCDSKIETRHRDNLLSSRNANQCLRSALH